MKRIKLLHNEGAGNADHTKEELVRLLETHRFICEYSSTKKRKWKELAPHIDFIAARRQHQVGPYARGIHYFSQDIFPGVIYSIYIKRTKPRCVFFADLMQPLQHLYQLLIRRKKFR